MSQSMIEVLTIKFFETFVVSNYGIDFFFLKLISQSVIVALT